MESDRTTKGRCRLLIDFLLNTSHPNACVLLVQALRTHYSWIANGIDKKVAEKSKNLDNAPTNSSIPSAAVDAQVTGRLLMITRIYITATLKLTAM